MTKHAPALPALPLTLDPALAVPLYRQLYSGLRAAILSGQLRAGTRLPPTRALAAEFGLSRNTVLNAFEQLLAEGYIVGKVGAGTYVAPVLPDELLHAQAPPPVPAPPPHRSRTIARRGGLLATTAVVSARDQGASRAFRPGLPAVDEFPFEIWTRLLQRRWRQPPRELLGYGDPAGYGPLREAIAAYLGAARAVRCSPAQVLVVAGSQQALDLSARVLLDPGDPAWLEEPGYMGARGALTSAGARVIPVPVGAEGLEIAAGVARCPEPRLVYVSPSHQYPLGVTMTLARRLELLEWADRTGVWVLEDDYDSEYRYASRPLAALQGLDEHDRVIYIGTFSKVLFPALRIGYMVVPEDLVAVFSNARALIDRHAPVLDQAVLADFIAEGHFVRHIRRMRALYAERQAALVEAAREELAGLLDVPPAEAGMHLVGWLPPGVDDRAAARAAAQAGLDTPPLSAYGVEPQARGGLLLGYAGVRPSEIRAGVRRLATALRRL